MNKSRIEAITDGIIAIAATIMVLELGIPKAGDWTALREIRHTFLAYVTSFFMIYIVWSMHHDLFHKAERISRKTFMVNGIWIFFLTLVPFSTAWVGSAPYALAPEFLYPLNLLLWSAAFHWLDYRIGKDNPGVERDSSTTFPIRLVMYGTYALCMALSFVKPEFSIYLIGVSTVVMFIWTFTGRKKEEKDEQETL